MMEIAADDIVEVEEISAGNIGAAVGLKNTFTGDTFLLAKDHPVIILPGVRIPEPVFTCSIEVESSTQQKNLDIALQNLQREDPSFIVSEDEETGQTLVGVIDMYIHVDIEVSYVSVCVYVCVHMYICR